MNGFFAALAAVARRSGGQAHLVTWWSERRCAATWGHIVRPDGYGRWREDGTEVDFFLEYDRGTEPLDRVIAKLDGYADLLAATSITTPTLFWLPTSRREAGLRRLLPSTSVPIATAHALPGHTPADAFWLPTGAAHTTRTRLAAVNQ